MTATAAISKLPASAARPSPAGFSSDEIVSRPKRLVSIDAYRGLVMLLMMGEVLHLSAVAQNTGNRFWSFLAYHQTHVEYLGCSLHDLIQSSFSFLVGVALPFSIASRMARGQSMARMTFHAVWRSVLLILLGVFLRSINRPQTFWSFTDTLCQIGFGYVWLFLLAFRPARDQWIALTVILVGYWLAFALYPAVDPAFDFTKIGVPAEWLQQHPLTGFAAHWNKYGHPAWAFDKWFLNFFPREKPWVAGEFGSTTLSFIPTLGTMILGLLAGGVFRSSRNSFQIIRWLIVAGLATLAIGWGLGAAGICPVVKRIWTPSWTLYSGGWCFLFLAGFFITTDLTGRRAWVFPLLVVGANSIVAYCMADGGLAKYIQRALLTHLSDHTFQVFGAAYEPLALGASVLFIEWLILLWMYRRKIFLRI